MSESFDAGSSTHKTRSFGKAAPKSWQNEELLRLDSQLRVVLSLIDGKDWNQLAWRTGLVVRDPGIAPQASPLPLPLVLELRKKADALWTSAEVKNEFTKLGIVVAKTIYDELGRKGARLRVLPATMDLHPFDPNQLPDGTDLRARLLEVLNSKVVSRVSLSAQHLPCLVPVAPVTDIPSSIGIPADRTYTNAAGKKKRLTGKGVVVGIIDDGCPFAHPDFLIKKGPKKHPVYKARVVRLWDQARAPTAGEIGHGWIDGLLNPNGPGYGREIDSTHIENAINTPVIPIRPHITPEGWVEEELVYEYLGYPMGDAGNLASHGSHVAGIAAGNGASWIGREGVAREADVVFVQLPPVLIDSNSASLAKYMIDAMSYIFGYADHNNMSAVVNISYGGYSGAHDGTMSVERAIDYFLALPNRVVVVSAGNGFEANCHAHTALLPGETTTRTWVINAEDPTQNELEVWYDGKATLAVSLTAPDGTVYGPFLPNTFAAPLPRPGDSLIIGQVDHALAGNGDLQALIALRPTIEDASPPGYAPGPPGDWTVTLANKGTLPADVHAWIRRDDLDPSGARIQQSRFRPEEAYPGYTICDIASGQLSVSVGAFNTATGEIGPYSAAGPTRPSMGAPGRAKPEICAPDESLPHGRGVLATSSARGQPTRFGGTSASAPHIAGLVALIFEFAKYLQIKKLPAATIQAALAGKPGAALVPNAHQQVSRYPVIKQSDILADVVGRGAIDFVQTMKALFP